MHRSEIMKLVVEPRRFIILTIVVLHDATAFILKFKKNAAMSVNSDEFSAALHAAFHATFLESTDRNHRFWFPASHNALPPLPGKRDIVNQPES